MWNKIVGSIAGLILLYMTYLIISVVVIFLGSFVVKDSHADTVAATGRILGFLVGVYLFAKVYKHQTKTVADK